MRQARDVWVLEGAEPRLLLISWHFPPDPAVGGLRWQKLVKLAAERGWRVDVVMRDTRGLPGRDPARLNDVPRSTRVREVALRPSVLERLTILLSRLARGAGRHVPALRAGLSPRRQSVARTDVRWRWRARDFARAWHAWVEHRCGMRWMRDAVRMGRTLIRPGVHRMIVSCGPPHWAHRAALHLSRESGVPFTADFRDPWSLIQRLPEHLATPLSLQLARRGEAKVMHRASLVVANTARAADAFRAAYPAQRTKVIAVPNGFDDDDALPAAAPSPRFVVAYAGTIYLDRDPRPLFRAAARLIAERGLSAREFGIEFMGDVGTLDGVRLEDIARAEGLSAFVTLHPPAARARALEFLGRASLLVVLPQDSDAAIPAKLFEYVRYPAWILVCGPADGAARRLVEPSGADGAEAGDVDAIARVLRTRYDAFRRGARATPLAADASLSRRAQAAHLFGAIEAITGVCPLPPSAWGRTRAPEPGDFATRSAPPHGPMVGAAQGADHPES